MRSQDVLTLALIVLPLDEAEQYPSILISGYYPNASDCLQYLSNLADAIDGFALDPGLHIQFNDYDRMLSFLKINDYSSFFIRHRLHQLNLLKN
jgi:hypothetical protein